MYGESWYIRRRSRRQERWVVTLLPLGRWLRVQYKHMAGARRISYKVGWPPSFVGGHITSVGVGKGCHHVTAKVLFQEVFSTTLAVPTTNQPFLLRGSLPLLPL